MTILDQILEANDRYAAQFDASDVPAPPTRHLAVLTCMDARLNPEVFLGLAVGDAHVVRNAGGRASDDAIRSLVISSRLLGTTHFLVIHHTDCGMLTFTNEQLRQKVEDELGADASDMDFLPFSDLEDSVRDDVRTIVEHPLLTGEVSGFVYDVTTGRLQHVVETTTPSTR